jgi:phage gp29-like protein
MNKTVQNFALRTLATLQSKINGTPSLENKKGYYAPMTVRKAISQTRRDIADLQRARTLALAAANPKQYLLQDIYTIISDDAHLTSQINNRKEQTIAAGFEMRTTDKKTDAKMTDILNELDFIQDLFGYILDSENFGYSLVELSVEDNMPKVELIPRRNVVPDFGRFYPDTSFDNFLEYRQAKEYKHWLLEFNSGHLGILNKSVPHALFKKFAQSCWSELCEIYGIPPRVMKTDTRDPQMLNNAENMMRDIGAAAWFIIDTTEEFEFAQGVNTNGDVYNNLIRLCNNEMSMLISGAVVGQDTKNGNESKEKVSMEITDKLVQSDKRMVEVYMNSLVIPALYRIGWIPATTSKFKFTAAEDLDRLFDMTVKVMPYKKVSDKWVKEKFGIEVTGERFESTQPTEPDNDNKKEKEDKLNFH